MYSSDVKNAKSRAQNVLLGRPSADSHGEAAYHRRRSGGREAEGSTRYAAKSQPGLNSSPRVTGREKGSRKGTKKSRKGRKSGRSSRKRRHEHSETKQRMTTNADDKDEFLDGRGSNRDLRAEEEERGHADATFPAHEDIDLGSLYANHPSITYIE